MKVLHLCLANYYIDGYSYQENLLPKYHKRLGCEVEIVASMESFDTTGKRCIAEMTTEPYMNESGILVTRLPYVNNGSFCRKVRRYKGLKQVLEASNPDVLFIHGCQFSDMNIVADYLKNHTKIKVFVDNHADNFNSASCLASRLIVHKMLWRKAAQLIQPYVQVFWGVLPARVDFMIENYGIPAEKCAFLPMGGDDDEILRSKARENILKTRSSLNVDPSEILIVTGGKIDKNKYQTLNFMRAFSDFCGQEVKLLVFGPVVEELRPAFQSIVSSHESIIYLPWATPCESYDYFAAADIVAFPGKHSVYWEQAASVGAPLLLRRWSGMGHLDCGGNVKYLEDESVDGISKALVSALSPHELSKAKTAAEKASNRFRYSDIAKRSICLSETLDEEKR